MIVVDNSWHLAEDLEVVGVGGTIREIIRC